MLALQIRQAVEAAPRDKLPEINQVLWAAFSAGSITEDEAETLSAMIDARGKAGQVVLGHTPRARVGSRPRSDASMERRRRWAAAGRLPPQLACRFTLAEQAVLAVVAFESVKRGDCRITNGHIAALAGVSKSTVRATLRRARELGIVSVMERRSSAWRNLTNVVRIVSPDWQSWMRLARRDTLPRGGVKFAAPTNTKRLAGAERRASPFPERRWISPIPSVVPIESRKIIR